MAFAICAVASISLFLYFVLPSLSIKVRGDLYLRVYFLVAALLYFLLYFDFVFELDLFTVLLVLVNQMTVPLVVLYSKKVLFNQSWNKKNDLFLLFPLIFSSASLTFLFFTKSAPELNILFDRWPFSSSLLLQIVFLLELFILPLAFLNLIRKYQVFRKGLKERFSSLEDVDLKWLRTFFLVEILSWFISMPLFLLWPHLPQIGLSIAGIGILYLAFVRVVLNAKPTEMEQKVPAYIKSGASLEDLRDYLEHLNKTMNDKKLFLENRLSLSDLAVQSGIAEHNISQTLNQLANITFYDYINAFRVEEVQRRIERGDGKEQTLLSIAMESGFNSKATFNRVFLKNQGITPSEALKKVSSRHMSR